MPFETLSVFFIAAILLGLTPGPDNIFVLSQSLAYGQRSGVMVTLGLCTGLLGHTAMVALGIAAILAASPTLFQMVKWLGVGYLIYLAWQSWTALPVDSTAKPQFQLGPGKLYLRGVIMNLTNPKVGLFFIAFLPQFVSQGGWPVTFQIVLLGFLFIVSTLLVFGGIAMLAGVYSEKLTHSPSRRRLMNRLVSVVFIMLAFNLMLITVK
jgi:threonine/homoserine/homoserine lactone efflux protein